jgi:hypothetical protein
MTVSDLAKGTKLLPMRGREPFLAGDFCCGLFMLITCQKRKYLGIGQSTPVRVSTHGVSG